MEHLFKVLRPVIEGAVRRPLIVLLAALVVSIGSWYVAKSIVVDPDFAHLIPEDYPSVQALENMRTTIGGGDVSVDLGIESPSFEANLRFAEALLPGVLSLEDPGAGEPFFRRAELHRDTEFLENNGLYFATEAELDEVETGLEEAIYEAKLEANPFFFDLDLEDEELEEEEGPDLKDTFERIVGKEYNLSDDSTTLVVRFFTSGSSTNVTYIERMYGAVEEEIARMGPEDYHPEMETVLAGRLWRQRIEIRTITDDVTGSFGVGLLCVLLVIMAFFFYKACQTHGRANLTVGVILLELVRAPLTAIIIGFPLFASLIWTGAIANLAFDSLTLFSSTLGLVLFGLGIDYGIHFYARYVEQRSAYSPQEAAVRTFMRTGQAVAVGAFTTAAALYVLVIADFKGFSQFGVIAGTGIMMALVAMLIVLPALLVVVERIGLMRYERAGEEIIFRKGRFAGARGVLLVSLFLVIMSFMGITRVGFEYRFGELEPVYDEWHAVATRVSEGFYEDRRNPAYIVVDSPENTPAVAAVLRDRMSVDTTRRIVDQDTFYTSIASVETLQERFPAEAEEQEHKIARIAYIRDTLLTDPLIGDDEDIESLRRAAQTREPIALEDVPDLLRQRFTSKDGTLGNFVTIYPAIGLSDGRMSIAFAEDVGEVTIDSGETYYAGSSSIVAADMLRLMRQEAPYMVVATLVLVILLMWANFLSVRLAILAVLPLLVGVLWMLLVLSVTGMRMNFYNLIVMPAIIGIGNDAGAHIVHRYREEGPGSLFRVLRSTGEHVTMGALTTMVGFSGLLLSFHPGLNTIGALALAGIGTTLIAALLFLPSLIQVIEDHSE